MESLSINQQLSSGNLFTLFIQQLEKDFVGAAIDGAFIKHLPPQHDLIRQALLKVLGPLGADKLAALLYRVDVSEKQLKEFSLANPGLSFVEVVAEPTIRRTLQKVMIRTSCRN